MSIIDKIQTARYRTVQAAHAARISGDHERSQRLWRAARRLDYAATREIEINAEERAGV